MTKILQGPLICIDKQFCCGFQHQETAHVGSSLQMSVICSVILACNNKNVYDFASSRKISVPIYPRRALEIWKVGGGGGGWGVGRVVKKPNIDKNNL